MKKFSKNDKKTKEVKEVEKPFKFESDKDSDVISSDVIDLKDDIKDMVINDTLNGEWEIVQVISVSSDAPTNEAVVINAEFGSTEVKRGLDIYITAMLKQKGQPYHQSKMGVVKAKITEIYNSLLILNNLK